MKNYISAISIAKDRINCLIVKNHHDNISIKGAASKALPLNNNALIDIKTLSSNLLSCIKIAEKQAKFRIKNAIINIDSNLKYNCIVNHASIDINNKKISKKNIVECLKKTLYNGNNYIIHLFPISYIIDNKIETTSPLSSPISKKLTIFTNSILAEEKYYSDLKKAIENCFIFKTKFVNSALATALGNLNKEDLDSKIIVLNFGNKTTKIAIFNHGVPIFCHIIEIGYYNIIQDISIILSVPINTAKEILSSLTLQDDIKYKREDYQLARNIADSRITEIIELIKIQIKQFNIKTIITTGKSKLFKLPLHNELINYKITNKTSPEIPEFHKLIDPSSYISTFGLIKYYLSYNTSKEVNLSKLCKNSFIYSNLISYIIKWIDDNI